MGVFRCLTCNEEIDCPQRDHMRSEWHTYNLKRKLASIPPVPLSKFLEKCAAFSESQAQVEKKKFYCDACKKGFNSENPYENHLQSQKHKQKLKEHEEQGNDEPTEETECNGNEPLGDESDYRIPIPVGACLFCDESFVNGSLPTQAVLRHMEFEHGFVLPYEDKVKDMEGLLEELGRIVGEEFACLGCGQEFTGGIFSKPTPFATQRKAALKAVRSHMLDTRHNFLYTGTEDPVVVELAVAEAELKGEDLPEIARYGGELYSRFYLPGKANKTLVLPSPPEPWEAEEVMEVRLPGDGGVMGHRRNYETVYRQNAASYAIEAERRWRRHCSGALTGSSAPTQPQHRQLVVSRATTGGDSRVSRRDAMNQHACADTQARENLRVGVRGNFVLRGHLRRQY